MKRKINQLFATILFAFAMIASSTVSAQCFYGLQLFDTIGDGWNGAALTITINGISTVYTLDNINDDGSSMQFNILINDGDTFTLEYMSGNWENEVSYVLNDSEGNLVFEDGVNPMVGANVFTGGAICPTCPAPLASNVSIDRVRAVFADVSWVSSVPGTFILEYDTLGFTPGTGTIVNTTNTNYTFTNLAENTDYEFYLSLDCGMDTSNVVGPYAFKTVWLIDVGVVGVLQPNSENCMLGADSVEILIQNFGQLPQSLIPLHFAVNGVNAGVPVPLDGYYTGVVSFDSIAPYLFETMWNFDEPGSYFIEVWTEFETDSNVANDTFSFSFTSIYPFALIEDFESGVLKEGWEANLDDIDIGEGHNSGSSVIYDNLFSSIFGGDTEMTFATAPYGFVSEGDELTFEYRYTDWSLGDVGTVLNGDQLAVQISTDCGMNYTNLYVVSSTNHVVSAEFATVTVDLSPYAGESVKFRFFAAHGLGAGDYWLDIDNINVIACPSNLGLTIDLTEPTAGSNDGVATVTAFQGIPPYSYEWSNAATTSTISGFGEGTYSVLVTDSIGCVDQTSFTFGTGTNTFEIETLESVNVFPNPTLGQATLQVAFKESTDIKVQVIDIYGKIISEINYAGVMEKNISLASDQFEAGMYFVRIETEGKWHLEKLLKL